MKIDDPEVQSFIQGQMSADQEAMFRKKLVDYPEVADLAETLKRTASLIQQDHDNNESPYGMELHQSISSPVRDQPENSILRQQSDSEPVSAVGQFFYQHMGQSWKFGVGLLVATLVISVFIFVVVPLLRSYEAEVKNEFSGSEFQKMVDQKSNKSLKSESSLISTSKGEIRNIPTHGTGTENREIDVASAFSQSLDPSLHGGVTQPPVYFSGTPSPQISSVKNETVLSLQHETVIQDHIVEAMIRKKNWNSDQIQLEAFANLFIGSVNDWAKDFSLHWGWTKAPWSEEEKVIVLQLLTPNIEIKNASTKSRFLLHLNQSSEFASGMESLYKGKGAINLSILGEDFYPQMLNALESANSFSENLIFLVDSRLSKDQAMWLSKKLELYPSLKFSVLCLTTQPLESHLILRSNLLQSQRGDFLVVSTPTQLQKALGIGSRLTRSKIFDRVRWSVEFDETLFSYVETVEKPEVRSDTEALTQASWLVSGEKIVNVFVAAPRHADENRRFGVSRLSYRESQSAKIHSNQWDLGTHNAWPEDHAEMQFIVNVVWLGKMLKGKEPLSVTRLKQIERAVRPLELDSDQLVHKQKFLQLIESLAAVHGH